MFGSITDEAVGTGTEAVFVATFGIGISLFGSITDEVGVITSPAVTSGRPVNSTPPGVNSGASPPKLYDITGAELLAASLPIPDPIAEVPAAVNPAIPACSISSPEAKPTPVRDAPATPAVPTAPSPAPGAIVAAPPAVAAGVTTGAAKPPAVPPVIAPVAAPIAAPSPTSPPVIPAPAAPTPAPSPAPPRAPPAIPPSVAAVDPNAAVLPMAAPPKKADPAAAKVPPAASVVPAAAVPITKKLIRFLLTLIFYCARQSRLGCEVHTVQLILLPLPQP